MNRIKVILQQQGRSQFWLSKQIRKSYVVTTNYCNNKAQPSVSTLYLIAHSLDVDVRELLNHKYEPKALVPKPLKARPAKTAKKQIKKSRKRF